MASGRCSKCNAAFGKGAVFCKLCGTMLAEVDPADGGVEFLTDPALDELGRVPCEPHESASKAPDPKVLSEAHDDPFDEPSFAGLPEAPATSFTLGVLNGPAAGRKVRLNNSTPVAIGSDADADFTLKDECVSRKHASLCVIEGKLILEDLGSTNGTFVRVSKPRELFPDDVIVIGDTLLHVGTEEL